MQHVAAGSTGSGDVSNLSYPSSDVENGGSARDATVRPPAPCILHRCLMYVPLAPFLLLSSLPLLQSMDVHMPDNGRSSDHGQTRDSRPTNRRHFFLWLTASPAGGAQVLNVEELAMG